VNAHYPGFLSTQQRTEALGVFADQYHLTVNDLEYLLALDSEEETLLTRVTAMPPSAQEVMTLYNQWTFEAALFNASSVSFAIDCAAFSQRSQDASEVSVTGVGAVIKRLCYLARLLGVYYDLEYESPAVGMTTAPQILHLTLYGPQEVTGAPQQYGLRLARLCRLLMGYGVSKASGTDQSEGRARQVNRPQLAGGIIEAEARVHFLQRAYTFVMDAKLLQLLPAVTEQQRLTGERAIVDTSLVFDSSIEQAFSEAFHSLARSQGVDGWHLEREPEPLLLDKGIFIADFALSRGGRRIYVEILGFWTPAYRERKIQKLQYLRDRDDLLLAIPLEAKESFASIAQDYPIVYYHEQLALADVLQLLRARYDDFALRLAELDLVHVRQQIGQRGIIPEQECYTLLHCYRRSELSQAAERVCTGHAEIIFVAGLGLCDQATLQQLEQAFLPWLKEAQPVSLPEAIRELRTLYTESSTIFIAEDSIFETLLGLWPEVRILRESIFDATVALTSLHASEELTGQGDEPTSTSSHESAVKVPGKSVRERKKTVARKHAALSDKPVQGDLWG
jgi:predicted nuclease of restriction endonuclease-like RecB superfamily